ncbi:hypothetical protein JCM8547_007660 [Rhodosporidiobolus lusitaniae]
MWTEEEDQRLLRYIASLGNPPGERIDWSDVQREIWNLSRAEPFLPQTRLQPSKQPLPTPLSSRRLPTPSLPPPAQRPVPQALPPFITRQTIAWTADLDLKLLRTTSTSFRLWKEVRWSWVLELGHGADDGERGLDGGRGQEEVAYIGEAGMEDVVGSEWEVEGGEGASDEEEHKVGKQEKNAFRKPLPLGLNAPVKRPRGQPRTLPSLSSNLKGNPARRPRDRSPSRSPSPLPDPDLLWGSQRAKSSQPALTPSTSASTVASSAAGKENAAPSSSAQQPVPPRPETEQPKESSEKAVGESLSLSLPFQQPPTSTPASLANRGVLVLPSDPSPRAAPTLATAPVPVPPRTNHHISARLEQRTKAAEAAASHAAEEARQPPAPPPVRVSGRQTATAKKAKAAAAAAATPRTATPRTASSSTASSSSRAAKRGAPKPDPAVHRAKALSYMSGGRLHMLDDTPSSQTASSFRWGRTPAKQPVFSPSFTLASSHPHSSLHNTPLGRTCIPYQVNPPPAADSPAASSSKSAGKRVATPENAQTDAVDERDKAYEQRYRELAQREYSVLQRELALKDEATACMCGVGEGSFEARRKKLEKRREVLKTALEVVDELMTDLEAAERRRKAMIA